MTVKPHVVILIPRLGITDRGAEVFVYELVKQLASDYCISILVRKSSNASAVISELRKNGISIVQIHTVAEKFPLFQLTYRLVFLQKFLDACQLNPFGLEMAYFTFASLPYLLRTQYDLLFPVSGFWGAVAARCIRCLRGIPFIYSSQGGIEPLIARQKPDCYIAFHPTIKTWLKKNFPQLAVTYISNGVNLKRFNPHGKKTVLHLQRPIVMTAGALILQKRIDLIIQAMARLNHGSLLIIGEGPLKNNLIHEAERLLGKDRFMLFSVSQTEIQNYYRAADIFTFAAPAEVGWGMVHLEALACGLPTVANREKNLIQLLGKEGGVTTNVTNNKEYANALVETLTHKKKFNPRQQVLEFSWAKIGHAYRVVIQNVLHKYAVHN